MTISDENRWALNELAGQFESAIHAPDSSTTGKGWGQFLDGPKTMSQVGLYGTASGLLVLGLAGRGDSLPANQALQLVDAWWSERGTGQYQGRRLHQTVRLATLHMGLRFSGGATAQNLARQVESALLDQVLDAGGWGDYYFSDSLYDPTPRPVPTALVLLALTLFRERPPDSEQFGKAKIGRAVEFLSSALHGNPDLPAATFALGVAALLSAGHDASKLVRKRLSRLTPASALRVTRMEPYFYEYGFILNGEERYERDYIVLPTEVLLALAGLQARAPGRLRVRARTVVSRVITRLRNHHVYRADETSRAASFDQAWIALLLYGAAEKYASPRLIDRLDYFLSRPREGYFMDKVFPVIAFAIASLTATWAANAPEMAEAPTVKTIAIFGTSVILALYRDALKALFGK